MAIAHIQRLATQFLSPVIEAIVYYLFFQHRNQCNALPVFFVAPHTHTFLLLCVVFLASRTHFRSYLEEEGLASSKALVGLSASGNTSSRSVQLLRSEVRVRNGGVGEGARVGSGEGVVPGSSAEDGPGSACGPGMQLQVGPTLNVCVASNRVDRFIWVGLWAGIGGLRPRPRVNTAVVLYLTTLKSAC